MGVSKAGINTGYMTDLNLGFFRTGRLKVTFPDALGH